MFIQIDIIMLYGIKIKFHLIIGSSNDLRNNTENSSLLLLLFFCQEIHV